MQNRRDFLKTAAFAAIGSGLSLQGAFAGEKAPVSFAINQLGLVKFVIQCRQYGSALMGEGIVCRHFFI